MKHSKRLPRGAGRFKTSDGLSLWFRIAGGGPALLVPTPGWGASVDMYMKSLVPLERDFSVVYLDTRGAGRSDPPVSDPPMKSSGYHFKNFLDDIEKLRRHLELDRWLIFGHSDASLQAMGYALEHPRTCHGLFIVDGTVNLPDDPQIKSDLRAHRKKFLHKPWFVAADEAGVGRTNNEFRRNFLDFQLPMYFASRVAAGKARHYFSASTYRVKHNEYDTYTPNFPSWKLERIRVPTAVFVGDSDLITTPLESLMIARAIPNATLGIIRNAGHFPWLQRRDAFFRDFTQAAQIILEGKH
jgi:pimeloyl-ACP methyl ester carboxylesterase